MPRDYASVDISFTIPQVHRLRMTEDILGADRAVLLDLIQPPGDIPAKVQVWIDGDLAEASEGLEGRVEEIFAPVGDRAILTSPPERVMGGESSKNAPELIDRLLQRMNADDLDRRSYVVVFGGGAVLDAVGYAASIAHRGIRLIRVPTTTLAQADSGVGVKTAVNWFGKKNWKGTFAVPWAVINDWNLLATLPDRDFRCGFSEAVKVSLLKSRPAFETLCRDAASIAVRDPEPSFDAIASAVRMHLDHITRGGDPFEMREARPLDFGHWSAHRMEPLTDYQLRHGEAVAIGVAIDTVYSSLVHGFPAADAERVLQCLRRLQLPVSHPILQQTERLHDGLEEFRQHLGGRLTVTMLKDIGQPIDVHEIDWTQMLAAIDHVRGTTSVG